MIYKSVDDWKSAGNKRLLFFGMSGVGKTRIASVLRKTGKWFHYSVDYRIGTRYMGEYIADNYKLEAMKNPFLANLLKSDSIDISSNITFGNLEPLSTYLGKPGDAGRGGIPIDEYRRRQHLHRESEIAALHDTVHFIRRASEIYDYPHFVCDTGGSICEVTDPSDPHDQLLSELSEHMLLVWIRGGSDHSEHLTRRFRQMPKPMCYRSGFLDRNWNRFLDENGLADGDVDPDEFATWIYSRALQSRQPRYEAMAGNFGVTIDASSLLNVESADECCRLITEALERRSSPANSC